MDLVRIFRILTGGLIDKPGASEDKLNGGREYNVGFSEMIV
jgi:hypothetical protein